MDKREFDALITPTHYQQALINFNLQPSKAQTQAIMLSFVQDYAQYVNVPVPDHIVIRQNPNLLTPSSAYIDSPAHFIINLPTDTSWLEIFATLSHEITHIQQEYIPYTTEHPEYTLNAVAMEYTPSGKKAHGEEYWQSYIEVNARISAMRFIQHALSNIHPHDLAADTRKYLCVVLDRTLNSAQECHIDAIPNVAQRMTERYLTYISELGETQCKRQFGLTKSTMMQDLYQNGVKLYHTSLSQLSELCDYMRLYKEACLSYGNAEPYDIAGQQFAEQHFDIGVSYSPVTPSTTICPYSISKPSLQQFKPLLPHLDKAFNVILRYDKPNAQYVLHYNAPGQLPQREKLEQETHEHAHQNDEYHEIE